MDKDGATRNDRQSIADVFADFYGDLSRLRRATTTHDDLPQSPLPAFSREELTQAIRSLKTGKSRDMSGILAEMLKPAGNNLVTALLYFYNSLLNPVAEEPASWRQAVVTVIFKSGEKKLPQNYRPIWVIPVLYKLFATF